MFQLQIAFIVWIIVGVFKVSSGAESSATSNCRDVSSRSLGTGNTCDQAFHPSKSRNCCPTCTAKTFSEDSSIVDFTSTFKKALNSSEDLSKLFGYFSNITTKEFSNGIYPEILKALTDIGAPNPKFASRQAVEAIEESFNRLTSDIVLQIYTNSIAKYSFMQGILTRQNSVQLGKRYSNMMEEAARSNDSQYTALSEGYVNFLDSLGLFTSDKALLIALQYGNEWKIAAKLRCR